MQKKHKRIIYLSLLLSFCITGILIIGITLQENISFFYYPTDLLKPENQAKHDHKIRLGGNIVPGSIIRNAEYITFSVTDNQNIVPVIYTRKVVPSLFREDNGVVVEGRLVDGKFIANNILAKHNENYRAK